MKKRNFTTGVIFTTMAYFTLSTCVFALEINDFTPDKIKLSGGIEIEAEFKNNDVDHENTSDISLATAELGVEVTPMDWVTGFALLSWEDDDEKIIFDEAHITIGASDTVPYYIQAGKFYIPFGVFETNMISDPLTLEFGEIVDTGAQIGIEISGFQGSFYTFNGEIDKAHEDNKIRCFGASVGYAVEREGFSFAIGAGWINNLLESGAMGDYVTHTMDDRTTELKDYVAGYSINSMVSFGPIVLIGEYIKASDDIEFTDNFKHQNPSVWALEVGYIFKMAGKETIFAIAHQGTDDAVAILPESKILASVGVDVTDSLSLALEYSKADEYSVSDDGTGKDVDALTMQLALEF